MHLHSMNFITKSPLVHPTPRPTALPLPSLPRTPLRPPPTPPCIIDEETRTIINDVFPIDDGNDMVCFISYNVEDHNGEVTNSSNH